MIWMAWKRISLAGVALAALCIAWLAFRGALFGNGPVTIAIQVLAALVLIWARVVFGVRSFHAAADPTGGGLITTGPYRYIRHPIYASVLYFVWAGIAAHWSLVNALSALVMTVAFAVRMYAEEHLIGGRYPEYAEYARSTRRVVPYLL